MSETMYCGQCGSANPVSNKFCGKCGSVIVNTKREIQTSVVQMPQQFLSKSSACPKCDNIDQIQKLTTIVTAGTRTTSGVTTTSGQTNIQGNQKHYSKGTGYVGSSVLSGKAHSNSSTRINITEQSDLVKKLALSPEPRKPILKKYGLDTWSTWLLIVVGVFSWFICAETVDFLSPLDTVLEIIIVVIIVSLVVRFLLSKLDKNLFEPRRKNAAEQYEIELKQYAVDLSTWKNAKERWDKMYYCYRDDVIFVPGESETATPSQLTEFCYKI